MNEPVPRWARPAEAALVVPAVPLMAGIVVLSIMRGDVTRILALLSLTSFILVGLVILRGHPRNVVGWSFLVSALLISLESFGDAGVELAAARGWTSPMVHVFAWATGATWFPGLFVLITVALLHFPDGRPLSPRWRWVTWVAIALMATYAASLSVTIWQVPIAQLHDDGMPSVPGWREAVLTTGLACVFLILPVVLAAVASLVIRWRRSTEIGRLQIRWVAAAGFWAVLVEAGLDLYGSTGGQISDGFQTLLESSAFGLIAVACGVAITRHGLYEIDRIISRALAYLLISALLITVYAGVVTAAGLIIPDRYGSIGVAVATLAAVALFVPLRTRIQHLVDRRFDRARYDAARLAGAFAARTRSDLSQSGLTDELLRAVRQAVAPASATIWMMPAGAELRSARPHPAPARRSSARAAAGDSASGRPG